MADALAEELAVLKVIFQGGDLDVIPSTSGGSSGVKIRIATDCVNHVGELRQCEVDLVVLFNDEYPVRPPMHSVRARRGLSEADVDELAQAVGARARELAGEPMVLQLCMFVPEFLRERMGTRRPPAMRADDEVEAREVASSPGADRHAQARLKMELEAASAKMFEVNEEPARQHLFRDLNGVQHVISSSLHSGTSPLDDPRFHTATETSNSLDDSAAMSSSASNDDSEEPDQFAFDVEEKEAGATAQWENAEFSASRYASDFNEERTLGEGGFGAVVLARNKLDGLLYAIKKVRLSTHDSAENRKLLREVTTIARLSHDNIVRYYQAWIEGPGAHGYRDGEADDDDSDNKGWYMSDSDSDDSSDDDGDSGASSSDELGLGGRSSDESSSNSRSSRSRACPVLYIQMEYCPNQTLRQLLTTESVPLKPDRFWNILKQVLEALAYLHSRHVIHRDLAPDNVFLDGRMNVKLGDFGLAAKVKSSSRRLGAPDSPSEPASLVSAGASQFTSDSLVSGAVGKPAYAAPELAMATGPVKIDGTSDIYSLGVILFEMLEPFGTGMERGMKIAALRERGELPAQFREAFPKQSELILAMTRKTPKQRPTATMLLRSELFPTNMDPRAFRDMLRTIVRPGSHQLAQVLQTLFAQAPSDSHHILYERGDARPRHSRVDAEIRFEVMQHVHSMMRLHGALLFPAPGVEPLTSFTASNPKAVRFIDALGQPLNLPYELSVTFARHVAVNDVANVRRYMVAPVFQPNLQGFGPPREWLECDFSLIGQSHGTPMGAEAEVIRVVVDVARRYAQYIGRARIYIGHTELLVEALAACKVPALRTDAVVSLLDTLYKEPWSKVSKQLAEIIPKPCVDALQPFIELTGALDQRLLAKLGQAFAQLSPSAPALVNHLQTLYSYIAAMRVEGFCHFQLVCAPQYPRRSGVVFRVVIRSEQSKKKEPDVLAVGGRFDRLVKMFRPPEATAPVDAVGCSISLERIIGAMVAFQKKAGQNLAPSSTDVLVYSKGGRRVEERLRVAMQLWQDGVRAEYLHPPNWAMDQILERCRQLGIKFVVMVRSEADKEHTVKLRYVDLNKELKLELSRLSDVIRAELNPAQWSVQLQPPSAPPLPPSSSQPATASASEPTPTKRPGNFKARLVTPPHVLVPGAASGFFGRKSQVTAAETRVASMRTHFSTDDVPTAIVDVPYAVVLDLVRVLADGAHSVTAAVTTLLTQNERHRRSLADIVVWLYDESKKRVLFAIVHCMRDERNVLVDCGALPAVPDSFVAKLRKT